jgi:hypothetical protein
MGGESAKLTVGADCQLTSCKVNRVVAGSTTSIWINGWGWTNVSDNIKARIQRTDEGLVVCIGVR